MYLRWYFSGSPCKKLVDTLHEDPAGSFAWFEPIKFIFAKSGGDAPFSLSTLFCADTGSDKEILVTLEGIAIFGFVF